MNRNITITNSQVTIVVRGDQEDIDLNSLLYDECDAVEELVEEDRYAGYYYIGKSGFSANYMYVWNGTKIAKSPDYLSWIDKLHLDEYLPEEYPDVDFTQPLKITILFGHKEGMDTHNLGKGIIDQIAEYYGFNDSLIVDTSLKRDKLVSSHYKGYMYLRIENI